MTLAYVHARSRTRHASATLAIWRLHLSSFYVPTNFLHLPSLVAIKEYRLVSRFISHPLLKRAPLLSLIFFCSAVVPSPLPFDRSSSSSSFTSSLLFSSGAVRFTRLLEFPSFSFWTMVALTRGERTRVAAFYSCSPLLFSAGDEIRMHGKGLHSSACRYPPVGIKKTRTRDCKSTMSGNI